MLSDFQPWIERWGLEPDGEPFRTPMPTAACCRCAKRAVRRC